MPTVAQHYRTAPARPARAAADAAPVVLMVSGGADSTALLVMACTSTLDIADGRGAAVIARERLHVLHVNHHLRGEASEGDEEYVRELCRRFGLPLCVEHADFSQRGAENLEAAAREVRYAAARRYVRELSEVSGTPRSSARILTAHTASDRTETFFMNAIKGSGPAGLSSIPRRRNIIVRPLIDRTHGDLCRYLEVAGIAWREDESNADTSYLRNFVRHRVVPAARERNPELERAIGSTCDILGEEDAFMSHLASNALRMCTLRSEEGLVVLDARRVAAAELALARRMVRTAHKGLAPEARIEMRHVEQVLACVAAGSGSLSLPGGVDARMEFGTLAFRTPAARERLVATWLGIPGSVPLANQAVLASELVRVPSGTDPAALAASDPDSRAGTAAYIDAAALGYTEHDPSHLRGEDARIPAEVRGARLWVDAPSAGDLMCPLGMSGRTKKLSDILNEAKVPVAERPAVPVVRTGPGGAVVWVAGIRLDDRFKCAPTSRLLIKLAVRPVNRAPGGAAIG